MVSAAVFRQGMALLPSAVTVVTTDGPSGRAGFTASAVSSVTDNPPTLLVCMNRSSRSHAIFTGNAVLCVNVLRGDQRALSSLFSNREVAMHERFLRCATLRLATGAPALADALVSFDGRVVATHDVGSHSIFIVEVDCVKPIGGEALSGLSYFNRSYHALS
jgi:flavin reductase